MFSKYTRLANVFIGKGTNRKKILVIKDVKKKIQDVLSDDAKDLVTKQEIWKDCLLVHFEVKNGRDLCCYHIKG